MYIDESTFKIEKIENDNKINQTFIDVISCHARNAPNEVALVFLENGDTVQPAMTYLQLHEQSMKFAAGIRQHVGVGESVVLLFQSSYEFAVAFFGCIYAGVISIPLPIPSRRANDWERMEKIIDDTNTKLIVIQNKSKDRFIENSKKNIQTKKFDLGVYEDLMSVNSVNPAALGGCDTAFLQYTSGSTGSPKGVILTHKNLLENQMLLKKGFRDFGYSTYLSWLPLFHDMGLIGNFMHAIFMRKPFIFMAPNAFLQKPIRWLKAISEYKVRVSGAPNFAYDLCVERIKEKDKLDLDLSSWKVAFNGAEPVRADTLKRFSREFKDCGFEEESFYPCYGTAESTLIISGATEYRAPVYLDVERASYENNKINVSVDQKTEDNITLVSSGKPLIEGSIKIVCPSTHQLLPNLNVGSIWLHSPCNSKGYWNKPETSKDIFCNRISGDDSLKDYLDTGDLGFLDGDNIYITGRKKDLLIFNGRNIYPQDIESCGAACDISLKAGRCAATSLYLHGKERLILLFELERCHAKRDEYDDVIEKIRETIYKEFTIPVFSIALLSPSTIPMTSSGKIRRQLCREKYSNNELNVVATWSDIVKCNMNF